jgi:S-adenosylmethionine-diacylgycerolhomoserine-N-methlytransferase
MIPKDLQSYYRLHSRIYDITRWSFLFGRNSIAGVLPELPPSSNILDLGCGTGKHLNTLLNEYPEATITGIDQSHEMLNVARKTTSQRVNIRNEKYSLDSFEDESLDLILASYSLSMMDDLEMVLKTAKTHLKTNCFFLVVDFDETPFSWFDNWMKKNHVHFDHHLFQKLQKEFIAERLTTRKGYLGLYTYSTFIGRK